VRGWVFAMVPTGTFKIKVSHFGTGAALSLSLSLLFH